MATAAVKETLAVETKLSWDRDILFENYMRKDYPDVSYEYISDVPVEKVDWVHSKQNMARGGSKLDADTVDRYALAMAAGDRFPALVAFEYKPGHYILAGGNHRGEAALSLGATHVDLYRIDLDDQAEREVITRTLNRSIGLPDAPGLPLQMAVDWMTRHGKTAKEAADKFRLKVGTIETELRYVQVKNRFMTLHLNPANLPKTSVLKLNQIHSNVVLRAAYWMVVNRTMSTETVDRFVDLVNDVHSEAEQLKVVESRKAVPAVADAKQRPGKAPPSIKNRLVVQRSLSAIEGVLEKPWDETGIGYDALLQSMAKRVEVVAEKFYRAVRAADGPTS